VSEDRPVLDGPRVINYPEPPSVRAAPQKRYEVRQGRRVGDGCEFSSSWTMPPPGEGTRGMTVTELEVSYDPDTCRAVFVIVEEVLE
jgi:hypothetical protein